MVCCVLCCVKCVIEEIKINKVSGCAFMRKQYTTTNQFMDKNNIVVS